MKTIRMQTEPKRTAIYVHVPTPERGLAVQGQELPNLPGSVQRAGLQGVSRPSPDSVGPDHHRPSIMGGRGSPTLRFTVAKDAGISLSLK